MGGSSLDMMPIIQVRQDEVFCYSDKGDRKFYDISRPGLTRGCFFSIIETMASNSICTVQRNNTLNDNFTPTLSYSRCFKEQLDIFDYC